MVEVHGSDCLGSRYPRRGIENISLSRPLDLSRLGINSTLRLLLILGIALPRLPILVLIFLSL